MCMQDFRLFSRKQNNTLLFIQKAQTNVVPKMHLFQKRTLSVSSRGFFFVWCFILTQFVCPRDVSHIQFITTFYYDSHLGNPQTSSGVLKLVQKCMMFAFGGYNSCASRIVCICISVEGRELLSQLSTQGCSLLLWIFQLLFLIFWT